MNINEIIGVSHANPYSTNSKGKASSSFGEMLAETAKRPMKTGNAYETYIHTDPLVEGTSIPESRDGVAVQNTQYSDGVMSVSMLADTAAERTAPRSRTLTEAANEATANAPPGAIQVFLPNDKTVCSHGHGTDQYVYAVYTEDSTAEDPIVRIYCRAKSGTYEYTCRLNDVDPENAPYAELCALNGHLMKQNDPDAIGGPAVPTGFDIGDMMSRQNFLTGLEDLSNSKMFSQGILTDAKAFLQFYSGLVEEKKQQLEEAAEFEALMNAVDNVIDGKAPMQPKEILERLSEPAKDTLEDMKTGEEVSKEEWTGLLGELRDMGAISDTEFTYSRSDVRFIPLGYRDENGEFVMYDGIAERFGLPRLLERAGMAESEVSASGWNGDPLDFLDAWIENLTEWREDLSRQHSETGAPKYKDFSPIEKQIEACTRVGEIVNGLLKEFE